MLRNLPNTTAPVSGETGLNSDPSESKCHIFSGCSNYILFKAVRDGGRGGIIFIFDFESKKCCRFSLISHWPELCYGKCLAFLSYIAESDKPVGAGNHSWVN